MLKDIIHKEWTPNL